MTVIDKLASSSAQRSQAANIFLAKNIVEQKDKKAVEVLVRNLESESKKIRYDCIKVLYEIGERDPELISNHCKKFVALPESTDNRMQWGAMTALDSITPLQKEAVFKSLHILAGVADKGSVITRDHYVNILACLAGTKKYRAVVFPLLMEQVNRCAVNQLAMYAEIILPAIDPEHAAAFASLLSKRLGNIEQESKRKRIRKILSILNQ